MKKLLIITIISILSTLKITAAIDGNGVSQEGSTYYTTTVYTSGGNNDYYTFGNNLDINLPYPSDYVSFQACAQNSSTGTITLSIDQYISNWSSTGYTTPTLNNNGWDFWGAKQKWDAWTDYNTNKISTSSTQIAFKKNDGGTLSRYIRYIKVRMAPHIRLTDDTPESHDFGAHEYGSSSAALPIKFKSFLSSGTLSVKIKGDNPEAFRVSNYINAANNTLSKIDNTSYNFTITYDPNTIGEHSAIIEISDNINKEEISVSGECIKTNPTLEWNISNFKFAAGDTILNPATSSPSFPITYSTSDTSIIKIEGNSLIAIGSGDVEISASVAEQEYYNAASITQTFTVTNKTIQYIDWEHQNFYMLKLGDPDQKLSAIAKDKLTNNENKNAITYTSSDENVVKIEGSTLKIIGTGRASITASVEETETYAGTTATKIVFVRESSDDCSTTFAFADTETYSESYSNTYRSIKKTFEWQDIIGETLTFTANGDIANIEVKDNTNNKTIPLTPSNNTYTGNIDRNTRSITITIEGEFCWLVWETFTISLSNIFVIPASYIETQRSDIEFSAIEIGKTAKETIAIDWANQPDFIHASIIDDPTNAFSIDSNSSTIIGMCGMSGTSNINVIFNPKTEGLHSAKMILKVGDKDETWATVNLTGEGIYCETRFVYNGNWNDIANWSNGIPGAGKNTIIETDVTIPNNYTAEVNDITISNSGKIIIEPQGALKVGSSINNTSAENLILQANENSSAILLFNNPADNKVNATVELHSIASSEGLRNGQPGNFKDPKWQYLGITAENVEFSTLNPNGTSNWIYRWDETQNATSCWAEKLTNGSTLSAWKGYCLAQESATTYSYSASLINGDHTYSLTYTPENAGADLGNNLLSNSYTAPIDITTLRDTNFINAEANIYIYNTGSYFDWKNQTELEGFAPGQVIVIPVNTVSALGNEYPRTIASAQAFFVKANTKNASFTIDYEKNVFGSTRKENVMRAKSSNQSDPYFNTLKIQITSSTSNDRLYLLENENTTDNFDNGYDAIKIFDNPNGPQIYATTPFGSASINTSYSFDGQSIGFVANDENEIYTISFDITNLDFYNELYLYDTETELYIDILNEEIYQFYGSKTPNHTRFVITSTRHDAPQNGGVTTNVENLTTWNNFISEGKPIYIYTLIGQLIGVYEQHSIINIPNGIYIVKCGDKCRKLKIENSCCIQ